MLGPEGHANKRGVINEYTKTRQFILDQEKAEEPAFISMYLPFGPRSLPVFCNS